MSVQLPASFGPEDLDTLDGFCAGLSLDWTWAVEVRHAEFAAGGTAEHRLHDLLRRHGVDRIILDSRPLFAAAPVTPAEREAWDRKPRLAVRPVALGWEPVVRIIGNSDPHDTIARWEPWIPKVASWLAEGRHPTVFLHTPDNLLSPPLARRFHADVAAAFTELTGRSIAALPAPATADQPSLF